MSWKEQDHMSNRARLVLEDGTVVNGELFGSPTASSGEVVFNTGMVGYPETLTDPSYRGQILILTYPLIGNYGVPSFQNDQYGLPMGFESSKIQAAGLIVSEHSTRYSHHGASRNLSSWLADEGIPGLSNIDTRALTRKLAAKGSMLGKIEVDNESPSFYDPNTQNVASEVCVPEVTSMEAPGEQKTRPTILLLDFGCKANIIRSLLKRDMNVIRVPHDHYFLNMEFDGILLSNGPGDPAVYTTAQQNVSRALAIGKPILGICMGHQILARAVGAETFKMKFGHRSHNQPCIEHPLEENGNGNGNGNGRDHKPNRCFITSQNHGFAVRGEGLPPDWKVWFTNANDQTVDGIRHVSKPFQSVQFHPEATPGPVDTAEIFDRFAEQVRKWQ